MYKSKLTTPAPIQTVLEWDKEFPFKNCDFIRALEVPFLHSPENKIEPLMALILLVWLVYELLYIAFEWKFQTLVS